jgi:hypothetical protein
MVSRVNGVGPTEWLEKIGSVYFVERNPDKTWVGYCEKYGVWKFDLSAQAVSAGRRSGSMSGLQWPERAYSEIGRTYWGSLTILEIDFRPREKPYRGGTRVVMDAMAYCWCEKFKVHGWALLESIRRGHLKSLLSVPHRPQGFQVSIKHEEYFADKTVCCSNGYHALIIDGSLKRVNRVVWELEYGAIPKGLYVDHINRNALDNRIENLRLATPAQNIQNTKKRTDGVTSSQKGVSFNKGKWIASCQGNGQKRRALFDDEASAIKAVKEFYEELNRDHGCFFSGH